MEQFIIPEEPKWTPDQGHVNAENQPWAVPTYQKGDWITLAYGKREFAPKGPFGVLLVWKAESTPIENERCGCGFMHRFVGADHFRRATDKEIRQEIQRLTMLKLELVCELDCAMDHLRKHLLEQFFRKDLLSLYRAEALGKAFDG